MDIEFSMGETVTFCPWFNERFKATVTDINLDGELPVYHLTGQTRESNVNCKTTGVTILESKHFITDEMLSDLFKDFE